MVRLKQKKNIIILLQNCLNQNFIFMPLIKIIEKIIGYTNQDSNSEYMEVGSNKFRKGNEGNAYVVNQKVTCDVYSEVDKAKSSRVYMGNISMICSDDQQFIGGWIQNGENGRGVATSENGKKFFRFYFLNESKYSYR